MAQIIPREPIDQSFNNSSGERALFDALKTLPDNYIVFHSVRWNYRSENGYVRWGEADFTIFDPSRGLIVIEVKSGEINCADGVIMQRNYNTGISKRIDPMGQAIRSKHTFREVIASAMPEDENYWIEAAVWFTSVRRENLKGKLPPDYRDDPIGTNVLYEGDIPSVLSAINKVFDCYKMRSQHHSQFAIDAVINSLSPQFDAIPSMSTIVAEQKYMFERMTSEQSYLLDYLAEQRVAAIQGGAGTGKTMLAIEKARRISSDEKVLFLCYNHLLIEHLKDKFSSELPNVTFSNLYAMAARALDKEVDEDEVTLYLNHYDQYLDGWEYKSIIIDEGQDFAELHIKLLADIAELHEGHFYIFYDKHQLVQQRHALEWAKDIECRLVLSLNCRNTKPIAETSGLPVKISKIRMRREVTGSRPGFYITRETSDVKEYLEKIIRSYTDKGFTQKDITILTCKTLDGALDNLSMMSGISSVGSYSLVDSRAKRGILFTTARKFKGLESDVVIIIDIDENTFSSDENRRLFYVAASRARHSLDLIACVSEAQEEALARQISGNANRTSRMAIMSGLKVKIEKIELQKV